MGQEEMKHEAPEATEKDARIKTEKPVFGAEVRRTEFLDHFDGSHASQQIQQESDALTVKGEQSVSSSDKEESAKPVVKEEAKASSAPEGYVRKEALDEERSRRKRLSQKIKELEKTYDDKFRELSAKVTQVPGDGVEKSGDVEDLKVTELQNKLRELESRLGETDEQKQRKAVEAQQAELNERIKKTDDVLRKEGFPGFKLAVREVDEYLRKLLVEEEIDDVDYLNPEKWMEVYREHIFPTVRQEFGLVEKNHIMNEKNKAKEAAARVTSATGIKQEDAKKVEEDNEATPDEERAEYLRFRQSTKPKMRFQ